MAQFFRTFSQFTLLTGAFLTPAGKVLRQAADTVPGQFVKGVFGSSQFLLQLLFQRHQLNLVKEVQEGSFDEIFRRRRLEQRKALEEAGEVTVLLRARLVRRHHLMQDLVEAVIDTFSQLRCGQAVEVTCHAAQCIAEARMQRIGKGKAGNPLDVFVEQVGEFHAHPADQTLCAEQRPLRRSDGLTARPARQKLQGNGGFPGRPRPRSAPCPQLCRWP